MILVSIYSLIVLAVLMGAQIWRPHLLFRFARFSYGISVFFLVFVSAYLTFQQYRIWLASPIARLLLPPNQPASYFFQYSLSHFWMSPMIVLAVSWLAIVVARGLNKKFGGRFFLPEEPWLFATAILLVGHPGWLYYLIALFTFAFLLSTFYFLLKKENHRFSFYWFWIPVAIGVILIDITK